MKTAVIGLGIVGLSAALGFADKGFEVSGCDTDPTRAKQIRGGELPFYEPGLGEALSRTLGRTFAVAGDSAEAVEGADAVFFCVGTPCTDDGQADLSYLLSALDGVLGKVRQDCVLVVKSTVPPGTTSGVVLPYAREKGFSGAVMVNPEFLREGHCWDDFVNADRIVCGSGGEGYAVARLTELYAPFAAPLHFVSYNTAEFIKYISNSLLATLVSFSNEMGQIADAVGGVDVGRAFKILHSDNRLDGAGISRYIYPGCGYGGYCLPKDTAALSANAKANGYTPRILDEVIKLNAAMPEFTAKKIAMAAGSKAEKIGILGLSFKAETDDVRDCSAAKIIKCLLADGFESIYAYDPMAMPNFRKTYGLNITYCGSAEEVCGCGTVALVTLWEDFAGCKAAFPNVKWVDCRYFWEA